MMGNSKWARSVDIPSADSERRVNTPRCGEAPGRPMRWLCDMVDDRFEPAGPSRRGAVPRCDKQSQFAAVPSGSSPRNPGAPNKANSTAGSTAGTARPTRGAEPAAPNKANLAAGVGTARQTKPIPLPSATGHGPHCKGLVAPNKANFPLFGLKMRVCHAKQSQFRCRVDTAATRRRPRQTKPIRLAVCPKGHP